MSFGIGGPDPMNSIYVLQHTDAMILLGGRPWGTAVGE